MNLTFVKCVQERKIDSNPTHYTKFDKSTKNRENKSGNGLKFIIFLLSPVFRDNQFRLEWCSDSHAFSGKTDLPDLSYGISSI